MLLSEEQGKGIREMMGQQWSLVGFGQSGVAISAPLKYFLRENITAQHRRSNPNLGPSKLITQPKPTQCLTCAHTQTQIYSETIRNTLIHAFPPRILDLAGTQIHNCCGYRINRGLLPGFRIEEVQSQIEKQEITLVTMGSDLFTHSLVTQLVLTGFYLTLIMLYLFSQANVLRIKA